MKQKSTDIEKITLLALAGRPVKCYWRKEEGRPEKFIQSQLHFLNQAPLPLIRKKVLAKRLFKAHKFLFSLTTP